MYHSISQPRGDADAWGVQVSPERFAAQIRTLAATYDVVALDDVARDLREGRLRPDCVAVTFDDGYANNLTVAAPILRSAGVPATLFLCTGFVGTAAFWWDRLVEIVFTATCAPACLSPGSLEFSDIDEVLRTSVPAVSSASRTALLTSLWQALRRRSLGRIQAALSLLADGFVPAGYDDDVRPMTPAEVALAAEHLAIGAHSVTHPLLSTLGEGQLEWEIGQSVRDCEALTGRPVRHFSYPFGDFNERTTRLVSARMQLACTTRERAVTPDVSALQIPRVQVFNWSPAELTARLDQLARESTIPVARQPHAPT
jgi:peptidoglycan/xylan/chitin deacetylase (PgdA/CDA1 family)